MANLYTITTGINIGETLRAIPGVYIYLIKETLTGRSYTVSYDRTAEQLESCVRALIGDGWINVEPTPEHIKNYIADRM